MSELLDIIVNTLDEKQAEDIVSIDMRNVTPFTDYFVVCTARNVRHASSLAEFVEQEAEKPGYPTRMREGERESSWILLDCNEVVVHIFTEEARQTYRLESLWADLPQVSHESKQTVSI